MSIVEPIELGRANGVIADEASRRSFDIRAYLIANISRAMSKCERFSAADNRVSKSDGLTMIVSAASVPEPDHVPDYSHAQQVAGVAVIVGLMLVVAKRR